MLQNKKKRQGCILFPYLFNLNREYIRMAGFERMIAGNKIGG